MTDAQIIYLPRPPADIPTTAGYYVESKLADLMPYAPIYRLYDSGGWLLGAQKVPTTAVPAGLVRLVPEKG